MLRSRCPYNAYKLCIENIKLCSTFEKDAKDKESPRMKEFRKKLQETPTLVSTPIKPGIKQEENAETQMLRAKTSLDRVEEYEEGQHPYQEKEPLKPFPDGINPATGEQGGPKGLEPTRYGDWERKGRVTDF